MIKTFNKPESKINESEWKSSIAWSEFWKKYAPFFGINSPEVLVVFDMNFEKRSLVLDSDSLKMLLLFDKKSEKPVL